MPRALWLAAIAAFAGLLSAAPSDSDSKAPSVGVFMYFDSEPGGSPIQIMEREVERLLKPSGIVLGWRRGDKKRADETFAGLVVFKFTGSCSVDSWAEPDGDFGTLGETTTLGFSRVDRGRVLPFGEVECDQIRRALAYIRPGAGRKERQKALGLALGRVVAHELYHMLANSTAHGSEGLAKASESLDDLVSPREMDFRETDLRAIGQAFR